MAGPTSNYGPGAGWPVQHLIAYFGSGAAACTPGGGTSYSDAVEWDAETAYNLGPGDHWFRAAWPGGDPPYFTVASSGASFFTAHTDASWDVWKGDGASPPTDVTGDWSEADETTVTRLTGPTPDVAYVYLVVSVPSGCRAAVLDYGLTGGEG
jgi:hypothetical protein